MASNVLSSLVLLLSVFLLSSLRTMTVRGDADLVMETCGRIKDRVFCIATLGYDTRALQAEVPGLATVAAEYASSNVTAIRDYLSQLRGDRVVKEIINGCKALYAEAAKGITEALSDLDAKNYPHAASGVGQVAEKPDACIQLFTDKGRESPPELSHWGEIAQHLCLVSLEIIQLL